MGILDNLFHTDGPMRRDDPLDKILKESITHHAIYIGGGQVIHYDEASDAIAKIQKL